MNIVYQIGHSRANIVKKRTKTFNTPKFPLQIANRNAERRKTARQNHP